MAIYVLDCCNNLVDKRQCSRKKISMQCIMYVRIFAMHPSPILIVLAAEVFSLSSVAICGLFFILSGKCMICCTVSNRHFFQLHLTLRFVRQWSLTLYFI